MTAFDIQTHLGFDPQWLLLGLGPVFLLTMLLEHRYLKRHPGFPASAVYSGADTLSNLALALLYQGSDALAAGLTLAIYGWFFQARLFDVPFNLWSVIGLLLLQDFCYYWFHRAYHRVRFFWCSHVVHHSSEKLNFSTALRQSITYPLTAMWAFWIPVVLVGFPPKAVLFSVSISLAYQFFVHTQTLGRLGWLEWIFNTPSHHRVHHGRNPAYIDRNYGGILIIWDRLFGTFVAEKEEEPPEYGIVRQIRTHNPLTLNFHEWRDMLRDLSRPELTPAQRIGQLLGPPERALSEVPSVEPVLRQTEV